jgi:uncharacterized protein DUF1153
VVRRKAALIEAVRTNQITLGEAYRRYELSPEEFANWVATISKHGVPGLRATRFQIYRDSPVSRTTGFRSGPNQRVEFRNESRPNPISDRPAELSRHRD